ncbi:MAG: DUF3303 family protein [Deltaproteobacteria bacterium]|nr:DUF3303 family protein [Deltaproteobacteria bacterium]
MAITITFWKLNPSIKPEEIAKVAAKIMEKGQFPPEGMDILGWYICPGGRGVTITESKTIDPAVAFKNWLVWVQEKTEFFEEYEVQPAVSAQEAIQMVLSKPKK